MPASKRNPILIAILGAVLIAVALLYFLQTANDLPSFIPGHEAGSSHHHVKHGVAALALGLGAFALAWFQSGPRRSTAE